MSHSALTRTPSLESIASISSSVTAESLPDRFAASSNGPQVWTADSLKPEQYVMHLSRSEVDRIRLAVINFKLSGLPRSQISKTSFHLPQELVQKLRSCSGEIHNGSGISVIRGLNKARFNDEESVIAFAGVSSHVCPERATDYFANQTLSHVRDATHDKVPKGAEGIGLAGSKLPVAMEFHADRFSGDVLALHVRNTGGEGSGGEQYLASFGAIYNELLQHDPDAVETLLTADWPFELKDPKTREPYLETGAVAFFSDNEKPMCQLVRAPLLGSTKLPRSTEMPKLSEKQLHALEAVERLASRFKISLDRQEGDIQYVHNLSVMHARSAYTSRNGGPSKRHLLRMFLRDPENAWNKPSRYAHKFEGPFEEGREQNLPVLDTDPWRKISGHESHG